MYGLVNRAIEDMVSEQCGEAGWEAVKQRAGLDVPGFISMRTYPDDWTYRLVAAASEHLGQPADEVLQAFGEYWVLTTAQRSYGPLMRVCGATLQEFLKNLDQMHARISLAFPEMQAPSFECRDETPETLVLHYRSDRPGLAPFVVGLVRGLGRWYQTPVEVAQLPSVPQRTREDRFLIRFGDPCQTAH